MSCVCFVRGMGEIGTHAANIGGIFVSVPVTLSRRLRIALSVRVGEVVYVRFFVILW